MLSRTTQTVELCALGGDTAPEIKAGESGERAKRAETEHRSIGKQGESLCL